VTFASQISGSDRVNDEPNAQNGKTQPGKVTEVLAPAEEVDRSKSLHGVFSNNRLTPARMESSFASIFFSKP
jgi:hypothetical protein